MDAVRARSVASRMDEARQLYEAVTEMEVAGIRRRHPDYDDRRVFLALVVSRYGPELANEVWPESVGVAP